MLVQWYLQRQLSSLPPQLSGSVPDSDALQTLAHVKTLVFVSTGFFQSGPLVLSQYFAVQDQTLATKQNILQVAGSLASHSGSSLLQVITKAAREAGLPVREVEIDKLPGGVTGKLERTWYVLGEEAAMHTEGIELGTTSRTLMQQLEESGKQMLFLAQKQPKRLLGIFACERLQEGNQAQDMQRLHDMSVQTILLTTERSRIAQGLAKSLGIDEVQSDLREEEISAFISNLGSTRGIAVVGTPATTLPSDVQLPLIVIGSSRLKTAIKVRDLGELPELLSWCRQTLRKTKRQLFWCKVDI